MCQGKMPKLYLFIRNIAMLWSLKKKKVIREYRLMNCYKYRITSNNCSFVPVSIIYYMQPKRGKQRKHEGIAAKHVIYTWPSEKDNDI